MGVDIEITPSVSFELGQENNNTMDAKSYGKLTVKLPLGNKQKFTNFAIASKAFKDSRKMDLGALAWVERNNKIMIEGGDGNTISFKGLTYKLVTSPDTGRVWLDRNLGATQVATSSSDSAAYGDHYPFSDISGNNDICPAGFGVPTERELAAETIVSTTINNPGDAISSFLKLPAAGSGATSSNNWAGSTIFLWTKTVSGGQGRYLTIAPNNINFSTSTSGLKFSVRCIKTRTPIVFNGLTYEMVTSPKTGRVWLDRNLGATQVATKADDSFAYGHYYQWGRNDDGHELKDSPATQTRATTLTPVSGRFIDSSKGAFKSDWTSADSNGDYRRIVAWADGGVNDICPAGFSVPTQKELKEDVTDINNNNATVSSGFLRLPHAGFRSSKTGKPDISGIIRMWTRSVSNPTYSVYLKFNNSGAVFDETNRADGLSVRCIKD
ncbi:Glutamate synthase [NADPH] large chain (EC [uncultured Gammaproteobacteria bacterium]|nr:Glutamate synthase [NADPH] large chain (EC [uncultured Gammaproteobacteria bacterium]